MTPARSVAASVVALGLAGTLTTGTLGAFSGPHALRKQAPALTLASAPRTCDRPAHYAAQSAAELLHINRLDLGRATSSGTAGAGTASNPEHGAATVRAVGLGNVRAVLIAKGPVNSAGAARILNGKVAGSKERNEQAVQQAPPVDPKTVDRRTGSKKFGPVQVGAGSLSARATWAHGMGCENAAGDTSTASAGISRFTIAGGGSASLVRVPEKITSRTSTALRLRGGAAQSVSSATITAGRISLVDNEVRLRVLQAPQLRASMTATGQSRVDYQPAVVEVSGKDGKKTRLSTAGDHLDITLSNELRPLESLPPRLDSIGGLPLPQVSGLPAIGSPETTPAPDHKPGSTLRIALGEARHATKNNAIAARATAIRVTLTRNVDNGPGQAAGGLSGVVADLTIGSLEAAAVAPSGKVSGRPATAGHDSSRPAADRSGAPGRNSSRPGAADRSGAPGRNPAGHGNTSNHGPSDRAPSSHGTSSQGSFSHGTSSHATSSQGSSSRNPAGRGPSSYGPAGDNPTGLSPSSDGPSGHRSPSNNPTGAGSVSRSSSGAGSAGQSGTASKGGTADQGASSATPPLRTAALPVTGPRAVTLLFAGLAMIIIGAAAIVLSSRPRKRS